MAADPVTKNTVSDLLNYDISDNDDPFQDIDQTLRIRDEKVTLSPRAVKRKAANDKGNDILGLDEEVKITKKRKPIAKLDETRSVLLCVTMLHTLPSPKSNDRLDCCLSQASQNFER